jgi:HEPN domain-containing protein
MGQDRATFQQLAEMRLAEARALHAQGLYSGAYYLAGYAIECALKAKIAGDFHENEIPELKRVQSIYTHDLSALRGLAVLKEDLDAEKELHPELYQRWGVARAWSRTRVIRFGRKPMRRLYWMRLMERTGYCNGC